jgi:hypothetical protein
MKNVSLSQDTYQENNSPQTKQILAKHKCNKRLVSMTYKKLLTMTKTHTVYLETGENLNFRTQDKRMAKMYMRDCA